MSLFRHSPVLSTGLAMFSMFFGAGNVVFPLVIGQVAGQETPYAIMGLLLTAVGVPFLGLLAIFLFQGSYQKFFDRLGSLPGFLLAASIMLLIGPFGGLPRCIALSHATLNLSFPSLSLGWFSLGACLLIFACTVKKNRILSLLGYFLTPLLLISLFVIVVMGLTQTESLPPSSFSAGQAFMMGLTEGYNTMDLLASFFFSSIIFNGLKHELSTHAPEKTPQLLSISLKASCIGGFLLSIVYVGFSYVAAYHAASLSDSTQGELLGTLTLNILGPYAGVVASATIALACLTTAIALASVFADFLQKVLLKDRISYIQALISTLLIGYLVSTLEFTGIVSLLAPLLQVAYPALIAFTIINILSSWVPLKPIKASISLILLIGLFAYSI